ncbi:hypothetical protein AMS68_007801 [Peltaster fructicola]|uniref:Major facilitator superfamily (MFS) profile domain-containing protein n=1 Tax=Peltaster fructicola TaxID=286661 RepID=A0A6H0Y5J4_9PEZI|nr:hypothetical protein AMS68_007801 [Peltaster fructicola]
MTSHYEGKDRNAGDPSNSSLDNRKELALCGVVSDKEELSSRSTSVVEGQSDVHEPSQPYHVFGPGMKTFIVCIVSAVAALSGLSSYMYFPAQSKLSKDLGISRETVNLSITTYIIAQGIGPSFWGPLGDHQGRRATLVYTLLLFVGANVALALSTDGAMLMVFRALQALGSASTISLGAGIIADISPPSERGGYIGWFSGVRQLSLGLGPVIGGILAKYFGWRSIFWFLVAFSAASVLLVLLVLPETLRRIAGNGSSPLSSWRTRPVLWSLILRSGHNIDAESSNQSSNAELNKAAPLSVKVFFEPLMFLLEKDVFCALFFGSCIYTAWSMMIASTTYLFQDHYGFDILQ